MNTTFRRSGAGLLVYRDGARIGEVRPSQAGAFVYIRRDNESGDLSGRIPYRSLEQAKAALKGETVSAETADAMHATITKLMRENEVLRDACRAYIEANRDGGVSMVDLRNIAHNKIEAAMRGIA